MKRVITSILTVCLLSFAVCAWAQEEMQGDAPEENSVLDNYFPGMDKADAQKLGAVPDGSAQMKAKISVDGDTWNATLLLDGNKVMVVSLSTAITDNNIVFGMLQTLDTRGFVPLVITSKSKDKKNQTELFKVLAEGKSEDDANDLMQNALGDYANQEDGSLTVLFCQQDMRSEMAKLSKAGNEDEKAIMGSYGDSLTYNMVLNKSNDTITVMVATLDTLFAAKDK